MQTEYLQINTSILNYWFTLFQFPICVNNRRGVAKSIEFLDSYFRGWWIKSSLQQA